MMFQVLYLPFMMLDLFAYVALSEIYYCFGTVKLMYFLCKAVYDLGSKKKMKKVKVKREKVMSDEGRHVVVLSLFFYLLYCRISSFSTFSLFHSHIMSRGIVFISRPAPFKVRIKQSGGL